MIISPLISADVCEFADIVSSIPSRGSTNLNSLETSEQELKIKKKEKTTKQDISQHGKQTEKYLHSYIK